MNVLPRARRFALGLILGGWLIENAALAQSADADPLQATAQHRLAWRYPRFRWWEYAAAGVTTAGSVSLEILRLNQDPPDRWKKPILLDATVRRWLRADTDEGRQRAAKATDLMWYGSTAYVVLDSLVTPLASDRLNGDVALQLTLLNLQAFGSAALLLRFTHVTVGRERPSLQGCSNEAGAANHCEFRGPSFMAGHAMISSTAAGLACAHHYALPLYGGGIGDALVCPVMAGNALAVGVLRMVVDKHWFSDTVPAWLLGGGIGFGMPWLLHYRYVRAIASPLPNTAIVPWGDATSGGLQLMGLL